MKLKFRLEIDGLNNIITNLDNIGVAIWSLMESVQNQTAEISLLKKEVEGIRTKGIPTWKKV